MSIIQAIILGLVQGLTEYIPISSSAHLIIFPALLHWQEPSLAFDVFLNVGTIIAILIYFKDKIISIIKSLFSKDITSRDEARRLIILLAVSTVAIVPLFLIIKKFGDVFHNFSIITLIMLAGFGIPMIFIDSIYKRNEKSYKNMSIIQAILIGVAQSLALISGVSRSGITIMAGLMLGLKKGEAKEYSFLVSIPVILGSFLVEALDVIHTPMPESLPVVIVGVLFSFIGGYISIKFLMDYLNKHSLAIFGYYRIILAVVLYLIFFLH